MNIYQRAILAIGAVALIIGIWSTPKFRIYQGSYYLPKSGYVSMMEPRTAVLRSVGIIGTTVLVFFALKDIEEVIKKYKGRKRE